MISFLGHRFKIDQYGKPLGLSPDPRGDHGGARRVCFRIGYLHVSCLADIQHGGRPPPLVKVLLPLLAVASTGRGLPLLAMGFAASVACRLLWPHIASRAFPFHPVASNWLGME